jgi:uncharacterized phage protein (TIGR02218 family)
MKAISDTLKSHLAGELTTLATCWRVTRQDGEQFFFTDHDTDLVIDGDTYEAATGVLPMGVDQSGGLAPDNMDVVSLLDSEKISDADLLAGLFDYASVDVFVVDYTNLQAEGGSTTTGYFGNQGTDSDNLGLPDEDEFGHFDADRFIALNCDDVPACTITKMWVYARGRSGYDPATMRMAVYNADDSFDESWTVEGESPGFAITADGVAKWYSVVCSFALTAGAKALAIISYNGHDTSCNVYYNDKASGGALLSFIDESGEFDDPLGTIIDGTQEWCMYAEYEYGLPLTDKLWIAQGWTLGAVEIRDNDFQVELRGKAQHLDQKLLDLYSPDCRADLGDSRCGVDLDDSAETYRYSGSVTGATNNRVFVDSGVPSYAGDAVFTGGLLTWLEPQSGDSYNGANATYQMEVKKFDPDTNEFELFESMPNDVEIGDEFEVTWGCDKRLATCRDRFDNVDNFRGEPYVPGWDTAMQVKRP